MSDGMKYFSHDVNAKNDTRILKMRIKHGWEGYGIYWAIIENLRDAKEYAIEKDYDVLSFDLRADKDLIKSIVEDFDLFQHEDGLFYSESLKKRMEKYETIRELRVNAGRKGGQVSKAQANAKQNASKTQAIKLNEIKLNEIKEEKDNTIEMSDDPTDIYSHDKNNPIGIGTFTIDEHGCTVVSVDSNIYNEKFESFRKKYKGTKRGLETEFKDFKKHKDWKLVVLDLEALYDVQSATRECARASGLFVPQEKNLKTYLNQRCWEEDLSLGDTEKIENPKLMDVVNYFYENGYRALAGIQAFNYYQSANWKSKGGQSIKNWKQNMIINWFEPKNKSQKTIEQQRKNEYHVDMSTLVEDEEDV
jgi:hypothetical protein